MTPDHAILADISRRLANLIRIGTVSAVDHGTARVRVLSGSILTDWLPWIAGRAGQTRTWDPPTVGEQALLFAPDGNISAAIVLPALYADARPAPSASATEHLTVYPDGARICYDHASGALTVSGIKTAHVTASQSTTVVCPTNTIDGNVTITGTCTVQGLLTYQSGMSGTGGAGAAAIIDGHVQVTGDVVAGGISLIHHIHSDPQGGTVSEPQ